MSERPVEAGGRVLIVIRQFFPLAAGAETQALRQAKSYIAMGRPTHVLTARHDRKLPRRDAVDGVPVTRLPAPRVRFVGSLFFLAGLAWYLLRHRRGYDSVLVFHVKQAAFVAALLGPFLGKRVVISDQAAGRFGDVYALRHMYYSHVLLMGCRRAAAFISGSSDITEELLSIGIPREKIRYIPNGIPLEAFARKKDRAQARAELGLPKDAFIAVNIGRQTAQKDLATLLAAWRDFAKSHPGPGALLVFVGDGDERPRLERLVSQWNIRDSVRFEGWRTNAADYLAAADVFVSSSISEGTHLALGEAMAAGLPVVATAVGGARDYVRDGDNGFVVPVGACGGILLALDALYNDPERRRRMGASAAQAARQLEQGATAASHLEVLMPPPPSPAERDRIRIIHIIATLDRGGSERQMAELAARLDKSEFASEVICLTRGGPTARILEDAGVVYHVVGKRLKVDVVAFLKLARMLSSRKATIVHTWLFTSNLYGRVAARMVGINRIVASERSTDPWKLPIHRMIDRFLSGWTRRIVANSGAVKESLVAGGVSPSKIAIIPNGVDIERFQPLASAEARLILGMGLDGPYYGFIGRLAPEKRPDLFLHVAAAVNAEMPEARAVIFGTGPMEDLLHEKDWRYRDYLTFYGDVPTPEIAQSALDCLVVTSKWEGFPNAILEAMAASRPVVAVRLPATEEVIIDGETGLLVSDNVDEIAQAVLRILRDKETAEAMGRRAREIAELYYSMDKMVGAYAGLYREIAARRTGKGGC